MSDIKKYRVEPTTRLHLRDARDELMYAEKEDGTNNETKPMAVNIFGPGSKQYAKAQTDRNNRMIDLLKKKGPSERTPEQERREQADFLAACTQSFENIDYDGLTDAALFRAVYNDIEIGFVAEQVAKHLGEWANFSTKPTRS